MQVASTFDGQEFLSDVYRGRPIAIHNRFGRWHVYLDHIIQNKIAFDSSEHAIAWLMESVDEGRPARVN